MKAFSILAILYILCSINFTKAEMAEEDVDNMTEAEYKNYLMR